MNRLNLGLTGLLVGSLLAGCGVSAGVTMLRSSSPGAVAALSGAPANYYAAAQGKTGVALIAALQGIVSKHKNLGYTGARDVMFGTLDDPTDTDTVACVYTGFTVTGVRNSATAYKDGQGLNTEHTWPQSLGATAAAKSDLHHLFPTEVKTNGARSSHPFGEVRNATHYFPRLEVGASKSKLGTNSSGKLVFEPRDEHKGNVARAIFYFYTVYGFNGSANLENFRIEHDTLLKWHQLDPVDDAERRRNDGIYAAQGNRNPYIDHPEYVQRVGRFIK